MKLVKIWYCAYALAVAGLIAWSIVAGLWQG